jgi:hypothetical protein
MRRRVWAAVAALACGSGLLPGASALAGYGAIAWDQESGRAGWVWNQPTPKKAAEIALSQCGATGCKVIIGTGSRQCAAFATTRDGKAVGAARRENQNAARLSALSDCQKRNAGECVVKASNCNK